MLCRRAWPCTFGSPTCRVRRCAGFNCGQLSSTGVGPHYNVAERPLRCSCRECSWKQAAKQKHPAPRRRPHLNSTTTATTGCALCSSPAQMHGEEVGRTTHPYHHSITYFNLVICATINCTYVDPAAALTRHSSYDHHISTWPGAALKSTFGLASRPSVRRLRRCDAPIEVAKLG